MDAGFNQFVHQVVYIHSHQAPTKSTPTCNAPSGVRRSSNPCESWVIANTNTRS